MANLPFSQLLRGCYPAVAQEIETLRGHGWPRALGKDPHEVAGGLCKSEGVGPYAATYPNPQQRGQLGGILRKSFEYRFCTGQTNKWCKKV